MRILFFCPAPTVVNGGIKQIFFMADALINAGYEVAVFEEQGRRPSWFPTTAPVVGQGVFQPRADEVLVLPEDQPHILALFKDWPQIKVLSSQNHYYGSLSLKNVESFADFGITHALCSSQTLLNHVQWRHPAIKSHLIPCPIDRSLFIPREKRKTILYMPRKRPVEACYIRDIFRHRYPEHDNWVWQEVDNRTEAQTAEMMGHAGVFLSLSRMESLGLTPLEAMACGCVVAGFTGLGGREYARDDNGFWAGEDDFDACAAGLAQAAQLAARPETDPARIAYHTATQAALAPCTLEAFTSGLIAAFREITPP